MTSIHTALSVLVRPALVAAALCAMLPARPALAQSPHPEREAVLAVLDRMFAAMRAKDSAGLEGVFHPVARLVGMRTRQDGSQVVQVLTPAQFAGFLARDPRGPWIERAWNPVVHIQGTLAAVWAEYDFHFGTQFSHCGIDAVHLLKTPDGWTIMGLADTYEREGCPARPVPTP